MTSQLAGNGFVYISPCRSHKSAVKLAQGTWRGDACPPRWVSCVPGSHETSSAPTNKHQPAGPQIRDGEEAEAG